MVSKARSWMRSLWQRARVERDMDTELRTHIEHCADGLVSAARARGESMSREEALRRARLEFGAVDKTKEECREARGADVMETFTQDLRYGARSMMRTPGFTLIAILALALGIGANTAIFSVVSAVMLRPLAYHDPDKLITILRGEQGSPISVANYIDYRDQAKSFEALGAAEVTSANVTGADDAEHITGLRLTQNILPLLGVEPIAGRWFAEGEDKNGADHEVILSYQLWQRRFSGDPNVVGKTVTMNNEGYTIVGVMPKDFKFAPFWATNAEFWTPLAFGDRVTQRGGSSLRLFGRLKSGVTLEQARAEMATITALLEQQYPGSNRGVLVTPLKEKVVGKIATPLLVLLGAVGFVLLIACANVGHILLARSAARQKEFAVRTALGANRGRVIRQFLTENLLLSAMGAIAGLVLAVWATRALVALSPASIPRVESITVDWRVMLFLLGISVLSSVAFGLAPALQASAVNLSDTLKEGGRANSDSIARNRLRSFLVASEFALALMLLVGAGLLVRSFFALEAVDPGFNPHNVLTMIVSVSGTKEADPERRMIFYQQMMEQIRALPGVESVAGVNHLPLIGDLWGFSYMVEGRPRPRAGDFPEAAFRIATPGYFQTMRMPLLRGRDFSATDTTKAPGVVIINERLAHDLFPGEDPIGKRITFDTDKTEGQEWETIIGVSKNAKQISWAGDVYPETYVAASQNEQFGGSPGSHIDYITLVVRTSDAFAGGPAAMAASVKDTVRSFDRNLPISQIVTMDRAVDDATAEPRFETTLFAGFAALALILAAVGIYGVMSYSVSRRTHEIGVRMSLGASQSDVLLLVVRQGMLLAIAGAAAGLAGALVLSRLMTDLLYGVKARDPLTFVAVASVLLVVGFAASYIPARRATKVDPMVALRYE